MAAKNKIVYICSNCGFESAKWAGKCPDCGEWNTMEESVKTAVSAKSAASGYSSSASTLLTRPLAISEIDTEDEHRYHTGLSELDRVLGGGLVKGSLVLISGDPGIGKSTILLQICEYLGQKLRILYVSGEESARQIKLRAGRLGVSSPNLRILAETDVQLVVEHIRTEKPDIVMIDSIQTMNFTDLNSSPGSVTQVRECTNAIMRCSKSLDIPAILVGHVNKDGAIAGPKVLEHIVDAVLYFEGDRQMTYRILRAEPDAASTPDIQYMLAILASRLGDEEQAVTYFLRSVELRESLKFRGNLDPEISRLIRKYGLFREDFE